MNAAIWNLDTGAGWFGKMTIWMLKLKDFGK
jgi:hypothetical protein